MIVMVALSLRHYFFYVVDQNYFYNIYALL